MPVGASHAAQEDKIPKLICDKRPEQLKMDFALWTRPAVMLPIERECAIKLSVRGVGNYLKRWGFTPQKPIRRAYEQRSEAVKKWLDEGASCKIISKAGLMRVLYVVSSAVLSSSV